MAKRKNSGNQTTKPATDASAADAGTTTDAMEQRVVAFAEQLGRIVGTDAMKFDGWQRLPAEYAKQFGVEVPSWPSPPGA